MEQLPENKNSTDDDLELEGLLKSTMSTIKKMARKQRRIHRQVTLETTEVVHETYLKLLNSQNSRWQDRKHFLIMFSHAMKNLLVDLYRKKMTLKRGEGNDPLSLDIETTIVSIPDNLASNWIDLEIQLNALKKHDPDANNIVLLRYFAGLNIAEIAETLNMSERSVSRSWTFARTWLHTKLK